MIIRAIRSDKPSFRTVRFKGGANIVLAERTRESAKKDTRNGLGKSTLLAILSYCLGGNRTGPLAEPRLDGWTFTLDAEHGGRPFSASRRIGGPGTVEVGGDIGQWTAGAASAAATISGAARIKTDDYKRMLGRIMFGLGPGPAQKNHPTFRSLAAYCMRQGGRSGGYHSPFTSNRIQTRSEAIVNNAYLLGLNWRLAAEISDAHDRGKRLAALAREATGGMLSDAIGSAGDLEAIVIRLEDKSQREEEAIRTFRVHKEYARLEEEADGLTKAAHDLVNKRSVQAKTLERYRQSVERESEVPHDAVLAVYRESDVIFPESLKHRLEEAREFHEFLVRNRREFLEEEMARLGAEVSEKGRQIAEMGSRKAEIMGVLETHGAIDELVAMQGRHEETVARKADASSRLDALREIERKNVELGAEVIRLRSRAASDYVDLKGRRRDAVLAFNRYSEMLYKAPGRLSIDMKDGEYRFDVRIERSGSRGIGNMKIFCYDLALASLWAGREQSPGFLAHDSEIFDGVDERQVALALQTAARESERLDIQYICTLNSDTVPYGDFDGGFGKEFESHVVAKLTDRDDKGGLLGIRF